VCERNFNQSSTNPIIPLKNGKLQKISEGHEGFMHSEIKARHKKTTPPIEGVADLISLSMLIP
jgi:hypothetical protein